MKVYKMGVSSPALASPRPPTLDPVLPQMINNINIEDRMLQTLAVVGEMVSYDLIYSSIIVTPLVIISEPGPGLFLFCFECCSVLKS